MTYEWYVVDVDTGKIINCITTQKGRQEALKSFLTHTDGTRNLTLKLEGELSLRTLEAYEFWDKRP